MPAFVYPVENDQVFLNAVTHSPNMPEPFSGYNGLMDTGAQRTGVSPRLVAEHSPVQVDVGLMQVANGHVDQVPIYLMNVGIAIPGEAELTQEEDQLHFSGQLHVVGQTLPVMGLPNQPDGFDVLLGMDLLSMFCLTLHGGSAIISFPTD